MARTSVARLVVVCSAGLILGTVLQSSLLPLLPTYAELQHFTGGQLALVTGAYPVGILLGALPTGVLVDRIGARAVMVAATGALAVSAFMLVIDDGLLTLVASRLLQGVAGCMVWGSAFPWVAETAPPARRGRLIGVLLSAGVAGGLVGPVVPLVVDAIGTRPTFAAIGSLTLVTQLATLLLPKPSRATALRVPLRSRRTAGRSLLLGGWLVALVGVVAGTSQVLGTLRLGALGASTSWIAVVLVCATGFQAVINPLVGWVTDRTGPRHVILGGLLAVSLLTAAFTAPPNRAVQSGVVLAALCSSSLVWGPAVATMSGAARGVGFQQGAVFAVVNLAWAVGTLVGNAGSGVVGSSNHQTAATLSLASIVLVTFAAAAVRRRPGVVNRPTVSVAGPQPGPPASDTPR